MNCRLKYVTGSVTRHLCQEFIAADFGVLGTLVARPRVRLVCALVCALACALVSALVCFLVSALACLVCANDDDGADAS